MLRKLANAIVTPITFGVAGAGIGTVVVGGGAAAINLFFVEGRGRCDAAKRIAEEKGCSLFHRGGDPGPCNEIQVNCPDGSDMWDLYNLAKNDPSVPKSTLAEWAMYGAMGGAVLGFLIGFGTGIVMVAHGDGILIKKINVQNEQKENNQNEDKPNCEGIQADEDKQSEKQKTANKGWSSFSIFSGSKTNNHSLNEKLMSQANRIV